MVFFTLNNPETHSNLEILVSEDIDLINPYTLTVINPNRFSGSVQQELQSSLNETILLAKYLTSNRILNEIKSKSINGHEIFSINNSISQITYNLTDTSGSTVNNLIKLGVTTTFESSGLLDFIYSDIKISLNINVSIIVKGSNSVIKDAEQGNLNIILTHSPEEEHKLLTNNFSFYQSTIFSSKFLIIGPSNDPAGIKNSSSASQAFSKIYNYSNTTNSIKFISRGDLSGTHNKELYLWNKSGISIQYQDYGWLKSNEWYEITGNGQAATFRIAISKNAYMLIDQPTFYLLSPAYQNNDFSLDIFNAVNLLLQGNVELWDIVLLSLQVHILAIVLASIVGIMFALILFRSNFKGKTAVISFIQSLMGFPPVVLGLILWYLFSRAGLFGDLRLLYTSNLMILAQFSLALPFIISLSYHSFELINKSLLETAELYGFKGYKLTPVLLNESKFSILTAIITAFGRIIGETGAMLIIGGNILGETRILTTSIVNEIESGSPELAIALSIVLIIIAILVMSLLSVIQRYNKILPDSISLKFNWYKINKKMLLVNDELLNMNNNDLLNKYCELTNVINTKIDNDYILKTNKYSFSYNGNFKFIIDQTILEENNIYGIIGPNSSGKTTFCKILMNINKNDKFELDYGIALDNWQYTHQQPIFFSGSVFDNLMQSLKHSSISEIEKMNRIIILSKIFEIFDFLGHKTSNLSVGLQQKVALIRSLIFNPRVLILDEIFSNLDLKSTILTKKIIQTLHERNKMNFLIVSHNIAFLSKFVTKFIAIIDGHVSEIFTVDNIQSNDHRDEIKTYLSSNLL